jgi:hypothetical protein
MEVSHAACFQVCSKEYCRPLSGKFFSYRSAEKIEVVGMTKPQVAHVYVQYVLFAAINSAAVWDVMTIFG